MRRTRFLLLFTPLFLLAFGRVQDKTAPWHRPGTFVGQKKCAECHDEERDKVLAGWHASTVRSANLQSCETCHGPGSAHSLDKDTDPELVTMPNKLGWNDQKELCGSCHKDQIAAHGGDLEGMAKSGKLCTSCHKVHEEKPKPAFPGVVFSARAAADRACAAVGSKKCVECHVVRDELLRTSYHFRLGSNRHPEGCEMCHGHGEQHVATNGLARLIVDPRTALDGVAICWKCHEKTSKGEEIDQVEFHWKGKHKPLLTPGLTCTSCHKIHVEMPEADKLDRLRTNPPPAPLGEVATFVASLATPPVTNALCATCHAPVFADILQRPQAPLGERRSAAHTALFGTIHGSLAKKDLALDKGCGSCHAGGEAHAAAGGKKHLVDALRREVDGKDQGSAKHQHRVCGACHDANPSLVHVAAGAHLRNEVGCTSCHGVGARSGATKADAQAKCTECHKDVDAQFRLPNHHPVPEGRMGCVDCHDPHGARPKVRDLELKQQRCVTCHKEYAGPFVFEHQAGRSDGCVVCHAPHGASNRRMLNQHTTQQNCLQCHADFPLFHDQTVGVVFTKCIQCHSEVHGSNHSRYLLR